MDYATNGDKTKDEQALFVSGLNCSPQTARQDMVLTKRQFQDDKEIVAFHAFQSFAPGEVTPHQAHQVGMELARRMWGERFEVIIATHLNTNCIHNHFVLNATSFVDGKRYYDNKSNLKKIRNLSDELCREHGLSVIEHPKSEKSHRFLHEADKAGLPTRYNLARQAIDEAVSMSLTPKDFERNLKQMGYRPDFNEKHKYWTIIPKGWEKPIRLNRLGKEYEKERILERIRENPPSVVFQSFHRKHRKDEMNLTTYKNARTLKGLYYHYAYKLGVLPKKRKIDNARLHYLLKEDLMKLDKISEQAKLLATHNIETMQELSAYQDSLMAEAQGLAKTRRKLWNSTRSVDEAHKDEIKKQINHISARMKSIRRDVKLCADIATRSGPVREKLARVHEDEQKPQRKEKSR